MGHKQNFSLLTLQISNNIPLNWEIPVNIKVIQER